MALPEIVIFVSANEHDFSQIVINTHFLIITLFEIVIFVSANEIDFSQTVINTTFS